MIYIKMDLALNNLQSLICHKIQEAKPNLEETKLPNQECIRIFGETKNYIYLGISEVDTIR